MDTVSGFAPRPRALDEQAVHGVEDLRQFLS
jgi:hypothetical protein